MTWMVKEGEINKLELNIFVSNQVLPLINSYLKNRSILIIDDNSICYSEVITNMTFNKWKKQMSN